MVQDSDRITITRDQLIGLITYLDQINSDALIFELGSIADAIELISSKQNNTLEI